MAGKKNINLDLRKSCCDGCRGDGEYCVYRNELSDDVGTKFEKDGITYTKSCKYFELD